MDIVSFAYIIGCQQSVPAITVREQRLRWRHKLSLNSASSPTLRTYARMHATLRRVPPMHKHPEIRNGCDAMRRVVLYSRRLFAQCTIISIPFSLSLYSTNSRTCSHSQDVDAQIEWPCLSHIMQFGHCSKKLKEIDQLQTKMLFLHYYLKRKFVLKRPSNLFGFLSFWFNLDT